MERVRLVAAQVQWKIQPRDQLLLDRPGLRMHGLDRLFRLAAEKGRGSRPRCSPRWQAASPAFARTSSASTRRSTNSSSARSSTGRNEHETSEPRHLSVGQDHRRRPRAAERDRRDPPRARLPWTRIGEHVGQRNLAVTAMCLPTSPSSTTRNCSNVPDDFPAQSASTSARAASRSRSSLALSRPTESPRRSGLTAVVCSTSTRVGEPSRSMVGRNDLGGAAVDVGATSTVESARSSSA